MVICACCFCYNNKTGAHCHVVQGVTCLQQAGIKKLRHGVGACCSARKHSHAACRCKEGFYCPSAAEQLPCPRGHFCTEQSMAPTQCTWLAPCPPGTAHPPFSNVWYIFIIGSALVVFAMYMNVRRVERVQQKRAETAGKHEILNMVRTLLVRLQKTYGGEAQRSILVEPIVRVEFRGLGMRLKGKAGRVVLENVSGTYQLGHLHAVMGPSGSGAPLRCLRLCRLLRVHAVQLMHCMSHCQSLDVNGRVQRDINVSFGVTTSSVFDTVIVQHWLHFRALAMCNVLAFVPSRTICLALALQSCAAVAGRESLVQILCAPQAGIEIGVGCYYLTIQRTCYAC